MPSNQTANYALNQWSKDDRVLMDDFNADNAKIDGALAAAAAARTVLEGKLGLKGNCRIWTTSYVGDGRYGASQPTTLTFPWKPEIVLIFDEVGLIFTMCYNVQGAMLHAGVPAYAEATWDGCTVRFYSNYSSHQMNEANKTYRVVAFGAA